MGVYNDADLLKETIDSVLRQSHSNFEFLIVNDGSTDDTFEQLKTEAVSDSRIRIIDKHNEGLTKALIDGCDAAKGKYIARIDLGDTMSSERLENQFAVFEKNESCVLVTSDVGFFAPTWELLWITESAPRTEHPASVLSANPENGIDGDIAHHGSVMFRANAYRKAGGYRAEFYYGQDWDLWYRMAEQGEFFVIPEVLYRARYFPHAISMSQSEKQKQIARLSLAAHVQRIRQGSEVSALEAASKIRPSKFKNSSGKQEDGNYFIGEALRRNGNAKCRAYFRKSIQKRPAQLKSYIRLIQTL